MSTITGLGGGSTIILPGGSTPTGPVAPLNAPTTNDPPAPLFGLNFSGSTNALRLGLAAPRGSLGDTEALLAAIAAKLKDAQSESRDNDDFSRSSQRLGNSARAAAFLQELARLNATAVGHEAAITNANVRVEVIDEELAPLRAQKAELEVRIAGLTTQIDSMTAQVAQLNGQISTLNGQINTANGQISTLQGQLATLNGQLSTLNTQVANLTTQVSNLTGQLSTQNAQLANAQLQLSQASTPSAVAFWTSQVNSLQGQVNTTTAALNTANGNLTAARNDRDAKQGEVNQKQGAINAKVAEHDGLVSQRDGLVGQVNTLNAQIVTLTGQRLAAQGQLTSVNDAISGLEAEKASAQNAITASQASVAALIPQMLAVVLGGMLFTTATQLAASGDATRDSFDVRDYIDQFEEALQQILAQVAVLVDEQSRVDFVNENVNLGMGDPRFDRGDGVASRFGAVNPAQTLALGIATALAGIIGTLRTLLDLADRQPQTPQSVVQAQTEAQGQRMRVAI